MIESKIQFWRTNKEPIGDPLPVVYAAEIIPLLLCGQATRDCIKITLDGTDLWVRPGLLRLG